jgi:rhodanese-related sulfurtransferase
VRLPSCSRRPGRQPAARRPNWPVTAALLGAVTMAGVAGVAAPAAWAIHGATGPPLAIAAEDLQRYRDAGEDVTVIDLRPAEAFRQGHLPRARSLPLAELRTRQAEVPRAGRVVLYGASPAEAAAAYQALRDAGYRNVMVLAGGLPAWAQLGFPLETSR